MTGHASLLGSLHSVEGEGVGRIEDRRLLLAMRDPDPRAGQPEQTAIEAPLIPEGNQTRLVWETRGLPVNLLRAYGAGIQIHLEHLADSVRGHELRIDDARWDELFPAYEALGVS